MQYYNMSESNPCGLFPQDYRYNFINFCHE